ncbi:integral membrane protein DUF92-domain-containing protein [Filobasidium floriforme]|uniref:integral membrane protein DUF92-domain-containing protein n=1 Tax=Filobasidium floriforme TaxID=5210 RepID=UPI001E8EDE08|nr:integral membrane protein DUF92-domain-containing protein [Filobasidium floriforme]KAH8089025.1 integral membrane protein DUF92-domain-containing protein [Filobasidium floriforme]
MPTTLKFHPKAFSLAMLLAAHGWRKRSLSGSGAVGAFLVGYLHLANDNPVFGVGLISFYALGTLATKYKAHLKAQLEESPYPTSSSGLRTASQVLSNSIPSLLCSLVYRFTLTEERLGRVVGWVGMRGFVSGVTSASAGSGSGSGWEVWGKGLVLGALGHLATCLGDTLSSELGILSPTRPILLTTLRPVPPGTNGAISLLGTTVSLIGGAGLGALFWALDGRTRSGLQESWSKWMVLGGVAGLGGSLLDSVLGSTLQRTLYNTESRRILLHNPTTGVAKQKNKEKKTTKEQVKEEVEETTSLEVIAGWDVLTNNQVNFISSATVSGVMAWMAWTGVV